MVLQEHDKPLILSKVTVSDLGTQVASVLHPKNLKSKILATVVMIIIGCRY